MAKRPAGLNSGDLRHLITIEEPYVSSSGRANEPIESWRKWRDAYAHVTTAPGREFYQQGPNYPSTVGQTRSEQIHRFHCRHFEVQNVTATMRIRFENKVYDITDIRPDHSGQSLTVIEARLVQ
ncbi:MAG: head-tail adaptor protein [Bacteroidota bacterium]|jgi:head-tail adaptor